MNPEEAVRWFDLYEGDLTGATRDRLRYYPVLEGFAARLSATALGRVREIVPFIYRLYPAYLVPQPTARRQWPAFRRWGRAVAWREAMRLVLNPEPCENQLGRLTAEQAMLLRWKYVDQLCDAEVARALGLPSDDRTLFDAAEAGIRCSAAYDAFERLISEGYARGPGATAGWGRQTESYFPRFPC